MLRVQDCGIMLEPQHGMRMSELVRTAELAEDLGFGYLFRSDHLLPTDDKRGMDSPECWTSLGAIAARTRSLRFGPLVTPVGFRNPALLAKMACTLHSYSGGRLQLAIGAGWYEPEYVSHGYSFPPIAVRLAQFREALAIISALVREGRCDFDGTYFSAHTDCLPRPEGEFHLIIGGKTKSLVKLAGAQAEEWNVLGSKLDLFLNLKPTFDKASGGRRVEVSEMGPYIIGRNPSEVERNVKVQIEKIGLGMNTGEYSNRLRARDAPIGTVDEFVATVRRKLDAGIQKFYFQTFVPENVDMLGLLADTLRSGV